MYDKIGTKIKNLAKCCFIVEAIAAVITGIVLLAELEELWCVAILLGGPVVAWVGSWILYGFGEIIDKLCEIERNTRGGGKKSETQSRTDGERIDKLEKLRAQGLITEEEYQQKISGNK